VSSDSYNYTDVEVRDTAVKIWRGKVGFSLLEDPSVAGCKPVGS
jgi:hypothetical protein